MMTSRVVIIEDLPEMPALPVEPLVPRYCEICDRDEAADPDMVLAQRIKAQLATAGKASPCHAPTRTAP